MPLWPIIIQEDLRDYLNSPQMDALETAALADNQCTPFDAAMRDVATRIRVEVQGCRSNLVDITPYSIPPELKTCGCWMIIQRLSARLPALKLDEDQKKLLDDELEFLKRISTCEVPVSQPTEALYPPDVQGVLTPSINARCSVYGRENEQGY